MGAPGSCGQSRTSLAQPAWSISATRCLPAGQTLRGHPPRYGCFPPNSINWSWGTSWRRCRIEPSFVMATNEPTMIEFLLGCTATARQNFCYRLHVQIQDWLQISPACSTGITWCYVFLKSLMQFWWEYFSCLQRMISNHTELWPVCYAALANLKMCSLWYKGIQLWKPLSPEPANPKQHCSGSRNRTRLSISRAAGRARACERALSARPQLGNLAFIIHFSNFFFCCTACQNVWHFFKRF